MPGVERLEIPSPFPIAQKLIMNLCWYDGYICIGQAEEEYTVSDDVTLKTHYVRKEAPTCTVFLIRTEEKRFPL